MDLQAYIGKASILIEATPYIQQFRGETFVIKLGGSVIVKVKGSRVAVSEEMARKIMI